jgi:hypothetical protein
VIGFVRESTISFLQNAGFQQVISLFLSYDQAMSTRPAPPEPPSVPELEAIPGLPTVIVMTWNGVGPEPTK